MFDEINGAKDYMRQASNVKAKNQDWAKTFYDMANAEMDHARNLYRMFNEHYKQLNTDPVLEDYMKPFKESVDDAFMEKIGVVKYMQEMYGK